MWGGREGHLELLMAESNSEVALVSAFQNLKLRLRDT